MLRQACRRCGPALVTGAAAAQCRAPEGGTAGHDISRNEWIRFPGPWQHSADPPARSFASGPSQAKMRGGRGVAVPMSMMKAVMDSPGVVADPYLGSLWTYIKLKGFSQGVTTYVKGAVASVQLLQSLHTNIKGFDRFAFREEVKRLYVEISNAHALGSAKLLQPLVTHQVLRAMQSEALARREGGWGRIAWKLKDFTSLKIVQGRMLGPDASDLSTVFAQLTVQIASTQVFAAYNNQGALVAGDPEKELKVEDFWVFERIIKSDTAKWRLSGRVSLPGGREVAAAKLKG